DVSSRREPDLGTVTLSARRTVEGQVIDGVTGETLPGARVERLNAELSTLDLAGRYVLPVEGVRTDRGGRFTYPWATRTSPVLISHPGHGRRVMVLSEDPRQRIALSRLPSVALTLDPRLSLACVAFQNRMSRDDGLRYVVIRSGESVSVDGLLEGEWTLHR